MRNLAYQHPNFALFSVPRSGSTWLQHCLNLHPEVSCMGEMFAIHNSNSALARLMPKKFQVLHHFTNDLHARTNPPWKFFIHLLNRSLGYTKFYLKSNQINRILEEGIIPSSFNSKILGFKVMRLHLLRFNPILENYLNTHCKYKIILLRKNILQRWVSLMVAKKKDNFGSSITSVSKQKFKLPLKNLIHELSSLKQAQDNLLNYKLGSFKLIIYYEDLLFNTNETWGQICEFLNIQNIHLPQTSCVKQNPLKISDTVSNFEELKSVLLKSEFQFYLDL